MALGSSFGTAQSVTDANNASKYVNRSAQTSDLTIAGTPTAGKLCFFEVYRDSANGSDTLASDAYLLGVDLQFV